MSKTGLPLFIDKISTENIKENETISKLLEIYAETLNPQVDLIKDPLKIIDVDFLLDKINETNNINFDNIRKELFKIHLEEIYNTFEKIGDSEEIYNKFKGLYKILGIPENQLKITAQIDKSINSQYLKASSSFKSKKGTKAGFFFVYDIVNRAGIQALNNDAFFNLIENKENPYEYKVETSMYKEVFKQTIVPLAHPVGFNWNFIRLISAGFTDYFGLEKKETLNSLILTCYGINGNTITTQDLITSNIFGKVKDFNISINENKEEEVIIDFDSKTRLIKEFSGNILTYDREINNIEIYNIELINKQDGILKLNSDLNTYDYQEYSIINKEFIEIKYQIKNDKIDKWNTSRIYNNNKTINNLNKKLFNTKLISKQDILENSTDFNGTITKDNGNTCALSYKSTSIIKVKTEDIEDYIKEKRISEINKERNINDINLTEYNITQEDINLEISQGRDPNRLYNGIYSTLDHTFKEIDFQSNNDNWSRLDYGNDYNNNVTIGQENKFIFKDNNWLISKNNINFKDVGFNSNIDNGRWENYYRPKSEEDLNLVKRNLNITSPNNITTKRYENDNTEYIENNKIGSKNNREYTAWEFNVIYQKINVFNNIQEYDINLTSYYIIEKDKADIEKKIGNPIKKLNNITGIYENQFDNQNNLIVYKTTFYIRPNNVFEDYLNPNNFIIPTDIIKADPVNLRAYTSEVFNIKQIKGFTDFLIPKEILNQSFRDKEETEFYLNTSFIDKTKINEVLNFITDDYSKLKQEVFLNTNINLINGEFFNNISNKIEDIYIGYQIRPIDGKNKINYNFNLSPIHKYKYNNIIKIGTNYNYNTDEYTKIYEYNTKIPIFLGDWIIGDEYIDGKSYRILNNESEIYRTDWENTETEKYNYKSRIIEKYDIKDLNRNKINEVLNLITDDYSKLEQDLNLGDFYLNKDKASIGYLKMYFDKSNINEKIILNNKNNFQRNTFSPINIGDFNISEIDYINGKGENFKINAEIYRDDWNPKNDEFESFDFKIYKKDLNGNWI